MKPGDPGVPILVDSDIDWLIAVEKEVGEADWRSQLLPLAAGSLYRSGRYDLGDLPDAAPLGGALHLYGRQNLNPQVVGDWSVGLIYTDYAGHSYRVIRCNGPHLSPHVNKIEGDVIQGQAHVHRLTQRYQELRRAKSDGYAEATAAYSDIEGALEHLAGLINLQPRDRMFL